METTLGDEAYGFLGDASVMVVGDGRERPEVVRVGRTTSIITREQLHGYQVTGSGDWNDEVGQHLKLLGGTHDLRLDST